MNYLKENVPVKTFKAILYNEMRLHDTTQQYNMCPAKLRKHTSLTLFNVQRYNVLTKPKNWVGLTVVNVRAVKHSVLLQEKVVKNYIAIG